MQLTKISPNDLLMKPYTLIGKQSLLLASGDFTKNAFNTMVISWGFIGSLWNKPCMIAPVRPTRYTYGFMEAADNYTLTAFPAEYKKEVAYLGTHSGRNEDKLAKTRLTPIAASIVSSPSFAEAELVLECRKIYWSDLNPAQFQLPEIDKNYSNNDYHRMYYGEILAVYASEKYIETLG